MIDRQQKPILIFVAALVLSSGLGSIHAFSVLLEPLESKLSASRAEIALAYSLGLAALTAAVLVGYRLYRLMPARLLPLVTCLLAASGLVIASSTTHPFVLWLGYGLIFGFANGVGYGFALYVTNQAFERHRGLAMGSVTAVYAVGASGFAQLFDHWIVQVGADGALLRLSITLVLVGSIASFCLWRSRFDAQPSESPAARMDDAASLDRRQLGLCWLTYGSGVAAGLMAMGHAAGIVTAVGGSVADGVRGAIAITSANAAGGFLAGYLADRLPVYRLLVALGVASTLALSLLAMVNDVMLTIGLLAVVGFAYGATIALFPIVTAVIFGRDLYARAYGRIFTSWGLAGLAAPWFAGFLYGHAGSYAIALGTAALLAALSAGTSLLLTGK